MLGSETSVSLIKKIVINQRLPGMNLRTKRFVLNFAAVMLGMSIILFIYYGHKRHVSKRWDQDAVPMGLSEGNQRDQRHSSVFLDYKITGVLPPPVDPTRSKVILFWSEWYKTLTWKDRFGMYDQLEKEGCPEYRCDFTYDRNRLSEADAILFKSDDIRMDDLPSLRLPHQRWVWVEVEAPLSQRGINAMSIVDELGSYNINWTMSYHSSSEVVGMNGYLFTLKFPIQPLRSNLIADHRPTMSMYLQALESNTTLEAIMGPSWRSFVTRPKLVVWMSSHCPTSSRREDYVTELQKYIHVEVFGFCGKFQCGEHFDAFGSTCWERRLRPQYLFYMTMENSLCDEYITEKLYNPLIHGLVPVVYGLSDYQKFLPPHSYINARHYHPRELGDILTALQRDPVAYGKYHVWRGYWKAMLPGSMCELCHRLHNDFHTGHHIDIPRWREENERCFDAPVEMFKDDGWRQVVQPEEPQEEGVIRDDHIFVLALFCLLGSALLLVFRQ
ncbi:alpha-(1,3)-fucosyltransferase C-like [Penaeus monodon]|uniref:alpha-(1,3)-fucosyltransferase C-like n=1 Tax=Penaeus monodon TaxID=6687 RepID=UPI0018A7867C|nr:alpha-(1,3)-fucosyltransferase C-like [Penaeus monodon]